MRPLMLALGASVLVAHAPASAEGMRLDDLTRVQAAARALCAAVVDDLHAARHLIGAVPALGA